MTNPFITVSEAIAVVSTGGMVILVDDEDRENEGDLVMAAEFVTAEKITFMSRFGCGLICLPMDAQLIDKLELPMMTNHNRSPFGTAFTVSIEASKGVSTGISSADRAHTIQVAINPNSCAADIISPGHMFPLRAVDRGVLKRAGQTEGSVDLMKIAGLTPAAVICEITNSDGTMSRLDDLKVFSNKHKIPMLTVQALIDYRIKHETLVTEVASTNLPLNNHGNFLMKLFENQLDEAEHFALIKGPLDLKNAPLVRIHSECITGDVFGSCKCDCGAQLEQSLELISKDGGVLIYLRQEGRGVGLTNKLKAYSLQEQGYDTVEANLHLGLPVDGRNYAIAYQILKHLGIDNLRLLTNNPHKMSALVEYGLNVSARVPVIAKTTKENRAYLETKEKKLGHFLNLGN